MDYALEIAEILRKHETNTEQIQVVKNQFETVQKNRMALMDELKRIVGEMINSRPSDTLAALFDTQVNPGNNFIFFSYFRNSISAALRDMPAQYRRVILPGDYAAGERLAKSIEDDLIHIAESLGIEYSIEKFGGTSPLCYIQFQIKNASS